MTFLFLACLLWAASFGLIGHILAGVPPCLVAFIRLLISTFIFLPFVKCCNDKKMVLDLMLTGSLQYGLMYLFYQSSYFFLPSHMVALSTILTPLYVTLMYDIHRKRFHGLFFIVAVFAILGAAIVKTSKLEINGSLMGFFLVQISNAFFAFGQVHYKVIMEKRELKDVDVFAFMYMGAAITALIPALLDNPAYLLLLNEKQIYVLLYLGIVPSGIAFFLWNAGARKVNAGVLSVFNNMKIPLAVMISILFFKEEFSVSSLICGTLILLAGLLMAGVAGEGGTR